MKKSLLIIMCLAAALTFTVACTKKADTDVTIAVTDANGEAVTDKNGEKVTLKAEATSIEYVTDADGKKVLNDKGENETILHYFVPEVDSDGETVTGSNKKPVTVEMTSVKVTTTKKPSASVGTTSTTKPETTLPEGTTASAATHLFDTKYKKIIQSGKFTIDMSWSGAIDGTSMNSNIVFAMDGSKVFMQMKSSSLLNMSIQMISMDKKAYIVFPSLKKYCETDEDIGSSDIAGSLGSSSAKYKKSTIVNSNGVTYICEEYVDGTTTYKYYFDKDTESLKRIEMSDSSTQSPIIITVNKLASGADSSYFSIPSSYKKVNLDQLESLLG